MKSFTVIMQPHVVAHYLTCRALKRFRDLPDDADLIPPCTTAYWERWAWQRLRVTMLCRLPADTRSYPHLSATMPDKLSTIKTNL